MHGQTTDSRAHNRGETLQEWIERTDARRAELEARRHYVYRVWDEYGLLLYIGCTVDLAQRFSAHRNTADWWEYVADVSLEVHPTRSLALEAEGSAIEAEGSYFNSTRQDIFQTQARRVAGQRFPDRPTAELDAKYPTTSHQDRIDRYLAARTRRAAA